MFSVSTVQSVAPTEYKHPRRIRLIFHHIDIDGAALEFDTEEAAREWRREIQGLQAL